MGTKSKNTDEIFEEAMRNESEMSDSEDFKLGAGGAATTGYHMNKKNANAKIRDLTNSEENDNQKEILNLLLTLLSINIFKEDSLTEEEEKWKEVLLNKDTQFKLGIFGSNFLSKFVNLQSWPSRSIRISGSLKNKQNLLEIINKIVHLLKPEIVCQTVNPRTISRQLRSFLLWSNGYRQTRSSSSLRFNISEEMLSEQKYIFTVLSLIKNLLDKTTWESTEFRVAMIREGILDTINHIHELCELDKDEKDDDKSSLPSFDYITSQVSKIDNVVQPQTNDLSVEPIGGARNRRNQFRLLRERNAQPFMNCLKKFNEIDKKMREKIVPSIKSTLEEVNYKNENLHELKRISKTLKDEQSSSLLCKEAMNRLCKLLIKEGMTFHEAWESKITDNLHKFIIGNDDYFTEEKSVWNRIHMFIDEFAENQKGLTYLIQNIHNLINDDESIEDIHMSDTNKHSFFNYNRWSESQQLELV